MKEQYVKPAMRVMKLQHQNHILAGSFGVLGLNVPTEEFVWKDGLFGEFELDM